MPIKSVTEERAETWKANKSVVVLKKKDSARYFEFMYVLLIFLTGALLMQEPLFQSIPVAFLGFMSAQFSRYLMFQELRGCNL